MLLAWVRVNGRAEDVVLPDPTRTWSRKYAVRLHLAHRFLRGDGIEVGAKSSPLFKKASFAAFARSCAHPFTLRLVDEMSTEDLVRKYQGPSDKHRLWVNGIREYPVDVVDNIETLATFEDESLDFVIANHVLEHVRDFLGTLATIERALRVGGVVFFALPDRRFNAEDLQRATTPAAHHLDSFRDATRLVHDHEGEVAGFATNRPVDLGEAAKVLASARKKIDRPATLGNSSVGLSCAGVVFVCMRVCHTTFSISRATSSPPYAYHTLFCSHARVHGSM